MGVSGCGKTTIARALAKAARGCFIEGDDFHPVANLKKMRAGVALQDADRRTWLIRLRGAIERRCARGLVCFVACSALKKAYRDFLRRARVSVQFVFLTGPPDLIRRRLEKRKGHFMPPKLLGSQITTLEPPRDAVIADITPSPEEISRRLMAKLGLTGPTEEALGLSRPRPRSSDSDHGRRERGRGRVARLASCRPPDFMKDHVYKLIELTGTSTRSIESAIDSAIKRAGQTVKNLRWFQVLETRGDIDKNRVRHWQVTIKVGFTVDE